MPRRPKTSTNLRDVARKQGDKIQNALEVQSVDPAKDPLPRRQKPIPAVVQRQLDRPGYEAMDFKLSTLRSIMIEQLEANGGLKAQAVVEKLIEKAMDGDAYCLRLLLERIDGLITKNVNVTGSVAVGQQVTLVDMRTLNVSLPIGDAAPSPPLPLASPSPPLPPVEEGEEHSIPEYSRIENTPPPPTPSPES